MAIFEDNLAVLQRHHPELYRRVQEARSVSLPRSAVDPVQFLKNQELHNPRLLIFQGLDAGDHVRLYFKDPHPKNKAVVIIEKSIDVLRSNLEREDWRSVFERPEVYWLVGQEIPQIVEWAYDFFRDVSHTHLCRNWENICWIPSMKKEGAYYVEAARSILEGSERLLRSVRSDPEDYFRGLINMKENIPFFSQKPIFSNLRGVFEGKPGIVVATGPSLDQSLPFLKEMQDKAVLFACDSALPILLKAGISPHFVACLERVMATKKLFENLPPLPETPLVALPLVWNETLSSYPGPVIFQPSRNFSTEWLFGKIDHEYTGSSSATLAFRSLDILGCNPLMVVGQDLAFDRHQTRSHAAGANEFIQKAGLRFIEESKEQKENWVEGNNSEPILSFQPFQLIANSLEKLVMQSGKKCLNVIPEAYGRKLKGMRRIEPSEISRNIPDQKFDAAGIIRNQLGKLQTLPNQEAQRKKLSDLVVKIAALKKTCLQDLEEWSRFYHRYLPSVVTPELKDLYEAQILHHKQQVETCFRNEAFSFLWPMVAMTHVKMMMEYGKLDGEKTSFEERTFPLFYLWEEWFRTVSHWAARTEVLFS